ncbi:MAG TPA: VWA domain-containing protein [Bacillota bacterium]
MILQSPLYLGLLLLLPAMVFLINRNRRPGAIYYSTIGPGKNLPVTRRVWWFQVLPWLTVTALALCILALARPQIGIKESMVRRKGIDIVLAVDVSTSMLAEDFQTATGRRNRIDTVKRVTSQFITRRPNDRIGIIIFAARPYILAPLTWDQDWVITRLNEVKAGMIEDGTAIGSALITAVNRLRTSDAKSKVVILLTDGMNNAGAVMPETAAEVARALKIKVYTIGAGSKGLVPYPVTDQWGRKSYQNVKTDLDETLLKKVANLTGGRYFRATDTDSLKAIFKQIDRLQKTVIKMPHYREYRDLYPYLLGLALGLLVVETILANTVLRRLP